MAGGWQTVPGGEGAAPGAPVMAKGATPGLQAFASEIGPVVAELAVASGTPSAAGALAGALAAKIGDRRARKASDALQAMFRAAVLHGAAADTYNRLARRKAPDLFKEAAALAARTGRTEREVLAAAMDEGNAEPGLRPIRAAMRALAEDPEMIRQRLELGMMARLFEERAGYVSAWVNRVAAGTQPGRAEQVGNAVGRLQAVLNRDLGARVAAMPLLDVRAPSPQPVPKVSPFAAGMADLGRRIEEFVGRMDTRLSFLIQRA